MKKYLFLISVAAVAMTACTNETEEYVGSDQTREISFSPIAQKATRAAVLDGTFPTTENIYVAAQNAGFGQFFANTTFTYNYSGGSSGSSGKWGGKGTAYYWPLSPATINFLAYAQLQGTATWGTTYNASSVELAMSDNSSEQKDLMYAVGQGKVTQTGNALSFPEKVDMAFAHAQALLAFRVKAADEASKGITVNSITLNDGIYSGTFTIDNSTNFNLTTAQSVKSASWTTVGSPTATLTVPGSNPEPSVALTTEFVDKGKVLVVPNGSSAAFTSFTISYSLDGKNYTYTYTPASCVLTQATKYIYDITFKVHEIFIDATVTPWTDGGTTSVVITPYAKGGTYTINEAATAAGTYSVTVSGLTSGSTLALGATTSNHLSNLKIYNTSGTEVSTTPTNGVVTITGTLAANASTTETATSTITLNETVGATSTTTINIVQAKAN